MLWNASISETTASLNLLQAALHKSPHKTARWIISLKWLRYIATNYAAIRIIHSRWITTRIPSCKLLQAVMNNASISETTASLNLLQAALHKSPHKTARWIISLKRLRYIATNYAAIRIIHSRWITTRIPSCKLLQAVMNTLSDSHFITSEASIVLTKALNYWKSL